MRALVCDVSVPRQVVSAVLGRIDKRFYFGPLSTTALREVPDPALPAADWLVLRTRLCGICGSDYKQLFLNGSMDNPMTAVISFPQVLGHEVVGTIERVGPAVRDRRVGERVVLNPWLSCAPRGIHPPCPECRQGLYSLCRNFARGVIPPGIHTGNSSAATGGFAPFVPAHESMCIPIPPAVSDEQAVLADPFSVSLHGILKRPPAEGATALVYGCGTLGLLAIAILRAFHPRTRVLAVARFAHQARLAERFGAAAVLPHAPASAVVEGVAAASGGQLMKPWYGLPWIHGGGVDVVYDTVGYPETLEVGIRVAASRGAIVVTGVEQPRRFEWTPLYFKEISIIGSNAFGVEEFEGRRRHAMEIYLDLVAAGRIDVTPIITHRFGLERYVDAFLACGDQEASGAVKVLFAYPDGRAEDGRH
ncbi:MAG TPA: alcohol dehydrogenase catalytic domain-containing protein [Candidatus Binatia bacterium]|nr:alcohol dehydrogenase catalytic domain-containing protein [Candidatus Binatia bacterium]